LSAESVVVLDALGLDDRQSQLQRTLFDRGGDEFKPAAFGTVRLRDYEMNVESSLNELLERGHGEARRAAQNEIERRRHWAISRLRD
jgi:hypothetical protein